jgi:hypothetical protein
MMRVRKSNLRDGHREGSACRWRDLRECLTNYSLCRAPVFLLPLASSEVVITVCRSARALGTANTRAHTTGIPALPQQI